jgi:hypothetical protein
MSRTVFGLLQDRDGMARRRSFYRDRHGAMQTRSRTWATPSTGWRTHQPATIRIDLHHNPELTVGELVHIERDKSGRLWGIGHVADLIAPDEGVKLYFSPSITFDRGTGSDAVIDSVAITPTPAQLGMRGMPLTFLDGALDHRQAVARWRGQVDPGYQRELLTRACNTYLDRRALGRDAPIRVHDEELDRRLDNLSDAERYIMLTRAADDFAGAIDDDMPDWAKGRPLRHRPARIISVR